MVPIFLRRDTLFSCRADMGGGRRSGYQDIIIIFIIVKLGCLYRKTKPTNL